MKNTLAFALVLLVKFSFAYLNTSPDSIRGALRPERTCFDVTYYDLKVDIDPVKKRIVGKNDIYFTAVEAAKTIQIDLFKQYQVVTLQLFSPIDSSGIMEVSKADYKKVEDALFVTFKAPLKKGAQYKLRISYYGEPNVAKRAPWDGGFVWEKDSLGRHFCGVACEGWGASSWWPCKDHLSDEPDSMKITFTVPKGYQCISNGELVHQTEIMELGGDYKVFDEYTWKVSYPINTYNVTFYLGKFDKVEDWYISNGDSLKTSFYALDYNIEKAKKQFEQVHPMLKVYEELFGRFPFWNDGYKLVEAPYLGMEHQTAIAYGNKYSKGYMGHHPKDIEFDYIIIHETGHEYWGNSVSMEDLADMWIHEGFCTYTEVLYTEKMYGFEKSIDYLRSQRRIANDEPIVGEYNINKEGSGDMYNKGSWMLHTLRNQINNDSLWFSTVKQFHLDFQLVNTNTKEVLAWFEEKLGEKASLVFNRYLFQADIPVLLYKKKKFLWNKKVEVKWKSEKSEFVLPILINGERFIPSTDWQKVKLKSFNKLRVQFDWKFALYDIEEVGKKKKE